MWNVQVSGLLAGATAVLYDGNPGYPDLGVLWRFAERVGSTFFGAGAAYYASCMKAGIEPAKIADLSALRTLGATGSPLPPEAYRWGYAHVKRDLWLVSIAGGTDLAGAFLTGLPTLPVYEGEMQCRALGLKVEAWDDDGRSVLGEVGELVCTEPFPSMPLCFWNDPGDARYRESYFETYPGVWRHGDWLRLVERPEAVGGIIYGRSDATINRFGIRMGTAELYRAVEAIPEVVDSLVVDLEYLGRESYMPLFVVLNRPRARRRAEGAARRAIRTALSARHVPSEILAIPEVPRTLSGKKMELPIKKLLLGHALAKVAHADAMANPASLDWSSSSPRGAGPRRRRAEPVSQRGARPVARRHACAAGRRHAPVSEKSRPQPRTRRVSTPAVRSEPQAAVEMESSSNAPLRRSKASASPAPSMFVHSTTTACGRAAATSSSMRSMSAGSMVEKSKFTRMPVWRSATH